MQPNSNHPSRPGMRRAALGALIALPLAAAAGILDDAPGAADGGGRFLPVGEAFKVQWALVPGGVAVGEFVVAPGYYLYRDRIRIQLKLPAGAALAAPELPAGETKEDPYAGRQVVYHHSFSVRQPISLPSGHQGPVEIEVVWQGCADAGLCYPPVRRSFVLRG